MQSNNEFGQELICGAGVLRSLPEYLLQRNISNIIIVRGHHSYPAVIDDNFWPDKIKKVTVLADKGLPDINKIKDKYESIKACLPSLIIAIGGGIVMDTAKTIIYYSIQDGKEGSELIAIPSTAGSGSEATPFAVVYNGKQKQSLEATALLPSTVFLDPMITAPLSTQQKAISGLDAWCQAIESYWSNKANGKTRLLSAKAFAIISKELPLAIAKENEPVSMELLTGAHYAGQAIRNTYTTGAHALSYHLTAEFGIPHGQAVAVFLPVLFLYNAQVENSAEPVKQIPALFGVNNISEVIEKTIQFIHSIGLKATLKELDLSDLDVSRLIDSVNMQRFSNNPRPYDRDALLDCIRWSLNNDE